MKFVKRLVSALLMLTLCLSLVPACSLFAGAAGAENFYYIRPELGDGASVSDNELESLYVKGVLYKNGYFTFTETRTLTFTVRLENGWSYNKDYSSVFAGDTGSLVTTEGNGSVTFRYTASAGRSIKFSSLKNVCINTTPDKLPQLYLNVNGDFDRVSKEYWVDCDIRLDLGTKAYTSGNYVGKGQVKGRGNYSWQKEQRPYSINLTEKASLLDIPATRKYAIVSTICDESLVRNLITYNTCQALEGIDYMVKAEPIEVYLNDSYNGLYTLVERIRISESKINDLAATPDNIGGAYLLEKTVTGKMGKDDVYFVAPFLDHPNSSNQQDIFTLADPDTASDAMVNYCNQVVQNVHNAIMSPSDTAYLQYIDLDSWLDFLIMQEVGKNVDGELKTSAFFLIPSGSQKLYFTSLWDFDLAYGNADWNNDDKGSGVTISGTPNAETVTQFMVISASCTWFRTLWEKPSFKQALKERYTMYRTTLLEDLVSQIDYYSAYMQKSVEDKEKYVNSRKVKEGVKDLKKWLNSRLEWLDKQWLDEDADVMAHEVTVSVNGKGTVTSADGGHKVADGGSMTYTIIPDSGYALTKAVFDGRDVTNQVKLGTYTTPYLSENGKLTVTFTADGSTPDPTGYPVYVDETNGGGKTAVSADVAVSGTVITVTATPDEGYELDRISVDGTVLNGNTFVMPAKDVTVTATYKAVVSTEKNREVLSAVLQVCGTDVMRAISNQSCTPVKDTYAGLLEQAKLLAEDTEAEITQINGIAMELLRMFGIMNRKAITASELTALADAAALCDLPQDAVDAARTAASGTDIAAMETAWNKLMNAYYAVPSSVLLQSVCGVYADVKAEDYRENTYKDFSPALAAAKTVLGNTSATQSDIDRATADLATAGRKLEPVHGSGDKDDDSFLDKPQNKLAIKILAGVLTALAVGMGAWATVSLVKRKKTKK